MSPVRFQGVDPNIIKMEQKVYSPPPPKAPGGFSRVMSAFGALAAPVGFATSIFCPPMAILGGFGLSSQYAGAHFQRKAAQKQMGGGPGYVPVAYPGLSPRPMGPAIQPAGGPGYDPDVMNIIVPRNEMAAEMTQFPGGK